MKFSDLKWLLLLNPPTSEQEQITQFLDRETARIDALIAEQQRLIELLEEKRQAVISHAVTKGLDPNAPMKDSGVEWLGEVPAHWSLEKLKWLLLRRNEKNYPAKTDFVLSLSIAQGLVPYSEKNAPGGNSTKGDLADYNIAQPGDIVINSMNVVMGAVGLSQHFGAISPVYYALMPRSQSCSTSYYYRLFQCKTFQKSLVPLGKGILVKRSESSDKLNTIRMKIPFEDLGQELLPVPPREEQARIVDHLNKEMTRIDNLVSQTKEGIQLLEERRTALISAAVTGKIDVRDWQPQDSVSEDEAPAVAASNAPSD